MTTYAPWSNPAQHPYLANAARPSLKRKHSYYTSASSDFPSAGASSTDDSPFSDASDLPALPDSADTTTDASQRHRPKRRRHEATGVEGDFDHLVLEQKLREQMMETDAVGNRETPSERQERFWELQGELEVDMDTSSHSPSSVIHPAAIESPPEQRSSSELVAAGRSWFEAEKDRIVITSLDSDSDSIKSAISQHGPSLENAELVSTAVVSALRGGTTLSAFGSAPNALFDSRRWGDLTPLERMTAGMASGSFLVSDEEMADAPGTGATEEVGMAMDVEM